MATLTNNRVASEFLGEFGNSERVHTDVWRRWVKKTGGRPHLNMIAPRFHLEPLIGLGVGPPSTIEPMKSIVQPTVNRFGELRYGLPADLSTDTVDERMPSSTSRLSLA